MEKYSEQLSKFVVYLYVHFGMILIKVCCYNGVNSTSLLWNSEVNKANGIPNILRGFVTAARAYQIAYWTLHLLQGNLLQIPFCQLCFKSLWKLILKIGRWCIRYAFLLRIILCSPPWPKMVLCHSLLNLQEVKMHFKKRIYIFFGQYKQKHVIFLPGDGARTPIFCSSFCA